MPSETSPPEEIVELVDSFRQNLAAYESTNYKETPCRQEYINPFFEALGWDVVNRQKWAEAYKDVVQEESLDDEGQRKAPDYTFRVGGTRKFFVEAKKPAVNIKENGEAAFQIRRYAWSAKLPLSVLTNFLEFAVYDCRVRPNKTDKPSAARILYITFEEFSARWSEIARVFSREAVLKGSFDRYADSAGVKKGTATVDEEFLRDIEKWRDVLARNIALRNPRLTTSELNFAVQQTIDRVVFIRICEDRGIEPYGLLRSILRTDGVYRGLFGIFTSADQRYNSGLFHFEEEPDRPEPPDKITPNLAVDDSYLKEIISSLYYPDSPYEFSVLPPMILGQVYEQFLGKVIRLTPAHRAVVENKPDVKKAGGVYYTPEYVVDHIVRRCIGRLLEGKAVEQAQTLRIVDPSCGSGSFLLSAYQYLLDWHLGEYLEQGTRKHRSKLFQDQRGAWRLTIGERRRILTNNIYGVDVDPQAVEVTKLSLLLKVLEGESEQSLGSQLRLFHERALPDLGNNIKCGNSLIGTDFYNRTLIFDDQEQSRINAFNWGREFPQVFTTKALGFDAVIGNPPWGASFSDAELAYLRSKHERAIARMIDSYIYFIDQALRISKPDALIGFIVPSTLLNQVDAKPVRDLLLERGLAEVVNLGQGVFGKSVLNTSTIFVSAQREESDTITVDNFSSVPAKDRPSALSKAKVALWETWRAQVIRDPDHTFFTGDVKATALLNRMRDAHPPLSQALLGRIERGVTPDVAEAHVVTRENGDSPGIEKELLKPSVSGEQIKCYQSWNSDCLIIYTNRSMDPKRFPRAIAYLERFKHLNTCPEVAQKKHPWWALHRARDPAIFQSPKFVGLTTSKRIELAYDESQNLIVTDAMYVFKIRPEIDPYSALAILQSKAFLFFYRVANQGESRVIPQVKASKLATLPFPRSASSSLDVKNLRNLAIEMFRLSGKAKSARTAQEQLSIKRLIDAAEDRLDRLVFAEYGLAEDEIELVSQNV